MRNELDGYPIAFQQYIDQHPEAITNAGDISSAFTEWQLPTVNGQQYYSAPDQASDGSWDSLIGNSQITLPDGRTAIPNDIATQIAQQTNQPDFIQGILNSSLPVMALGGALGAFGAFGPEGFSGLSNPFSGGLPSSGGSFGEGAAEGGSSLYGGNAGGASLYDIPGLGNVDMGALTGGAGSGEGLAGALNLSGPATTAAGAGLSGLGGIGSTLQALSGGNGPSQEGYNYLDPSTYGGSSGGSSGLLSALQSAFPNANLGSLLSGALQGGLGYLGAKEQSSALKEMQDKYLALGAPYRDKLAATYAPGYSVFDDSATKDAATRAADVAARSYSATSGNPFDQPSAQGGIYNSVLSGVALPQLNTTRSQLGSFGQLGLSTAGTAGLGAADQAGGGLNAIGYGVGTALNPQPNISDLLKQFGTGYKLTKD